MRRITLALLAGIMVAVALRAFLPPAAGVASDRPVPTPTSVDLYGASVGFTLQPGDVVGVRNTAGKLCGLCEVATPGFYGMLHVYGDDPTTPEREGAVPGEPLLIEVNGQTVMPAGAEPVWTRDGDRQRVNLAR